MEIGKVYKVLLVEDMEEKLREYRKWLKQFEKMSQSKIITDEATGVIHALNLLEKERYDVTILDYQISGGTAIDLLDKLKDKSRCGKIIGVSGIISPTSDEAQEMMSKGALDVIYRGETHYKIFREIVEYALDLPSRFDLSRFEDSEIADYRDWLESEFVGDSIFSNKVRVQICHAAISEHLTVLITGPTGSGKEVVAQCVHRLSTAGREGRDWIAINCSALSSDLLEAELFGVEKGAATQVSEREGYLEAAEGTTLFLDEIGHSADRFQYALLRAIETGEAYRVGSTKSYRIRNLRYIAATTDKELEKLSESFLYRLSGIKIDLLMLNHPFRSGDIEKLIEHFVHDIGKRQNRSIKNFTSGALKALRNAHWPGNVRELRHFINLLIDETESTLTITEARVSRLLQERVSNIVYELPKGKKERSYEDLIQKGLNNKEITEAVQRELFMFVHKKFANGVRSNDAYQIVAAKLGCGITKVKQMLKD